MKYLRLIAGAFVGAGGLILLIQGEYDKGMVLLVGLLSFFVGENNGKRLGPGASN